ncbi:DICT sensory domain-containing protein [Haloarcula salina]|uniref:Histidine kinase n=1 Tax=Haloarcula salina TaxID=1429914 RepID=A0AA41KKL6_9EURY|nr:DICT sensory domain-containing protein [Haloarcula salina]MBV0902004.1 histidine kinase [Haloarcula salina]
MSLTELIAGVEDHQKTLTVFNAGESVVDDLRERFSDRNVRVRAERTESGRPGEFITLSDGDEVVAAASLDSFTETLSNGDRYITRDSSPYRSILDHMDETMFTSWSIERMVAASREIEDRAWRVGNGSLHAGFQTLSTLQGELDLYERLGETEVSVHAYAVPDIEPPESSAFSLHLERSQEIADSWFVVFDGGGDPRQKCALLAEEREPRQFYGFWTYDESTVDWIIDYLESTYGYLEQ